MRTKVTTKASHRVQEQMIILVGWGMRNLNLKMMDDEIYKDIEEFEKNREKTPYDALFDKSFEKKELQNEENEIFEQKFSQHLENFLQNPCTFNIVELVEDVKENPIFGYESSFNCSFLKLVLSCLADPKLSVENGTVLLNFIIEILEIPDTQFSFKLCDEGIIPILYKLVEENHKDYWVNVVVCLSLLMKNNYQSYTEEIYKKLFKPVISSIETADTLLSTQASLLFAYSCCNNQKFSEKRVKTLVDVLLFALQLPDFLCLFYALSSLKTIARKYQDLIYLFSTTKLTMGIATLLPEPPFSSEEDKRAIISLTLDIFEIIFTIDQSASYTFPAAHIIPRIVDLLSSEDIGVVMRAYDVIDAGICHFYGASINFLISGLSTKLNCSIENSFLVVKSKAISIFNHLCLYSEPETVVQVLNDPNFEVVYHAIHGLSGPLFIDFAKSLIAALRKCDEASLGDDARELLIGLEIPHMISEVIEENDNEDDKFSKELINIAQELSELIQPTKEDE